MRKFAAIFLPLALLAASPTTTAAPVGATPGSHQVSPSGAFTYTIPIAVPPGTGGIEPKLSLAYNSQGGNDLMGMGWSLSGLSVIHRCPKTVAQDGVLHGVNYDANDRYCLDGQRLVAISGAYGADATEYRTESESYSRIVSYGSQGTGPSWWKVWTKSGQILEFGNTDDSKIEAQGKTEVMVWSLNKLSDTVSNYLTVTYIEDNANGQYYPDRIDYTGNATTGKSPINSVRFVYETRPDITPTYHAGSLNKITVRMTNVQAHAGTIMSRDYRLEYEQSTVTLRSRLIGLRECVSDIDCLTGMAMTWQEGDGNFTHWTNYSAGRGATNNLTHFFADVNGDGKADWIQVSNTTNDGWVGLATNDGNFTHWTNYSNARGAANNYQHYFSDVNGDGKADWIQVARGYNGGWVGLATGDGDFTHWSNYSVGRGATNNFTHFFADVNGDGKADWIQVSNTTNDGWVGLATNDGNFTHWTNYSAGRGATNNFTHFFADVNGDGKADWIQVSNTTNDGWVGLATNDGNFTHWTNYSNARGAANSYQHYFSDVNGDGKADWIQVARGYNGGWVGLATGDGNFTHWSNYSVGRGATNNFTHFFADVNGDGKADWIQVSNTTNDGWVGLATNDGNFTHWTNYSAGRGATNNFTHFFADVNGDGKADWIQVARGYNGGWVGLATGAEPDFLATLTNGLNATTTVTYTPLTDNTVYTKDATAVYPVVDIQAPMYVVSSVATSDGIGGSHATDYTYAGAKSHQLGGGFLGFRQATVRDRQTGIRSVTNYRQTYPYHGAPLSTERRTSNNTLIDQSLITYTDQLLNTGISPTWHQSLPTHTVESSYELNGSLISTAITDTVYDNYGNPTSIVVNSGGGYSKTTTNTYDNIVDPDRWFLGRLRRSTVKSVTP